MLFTLGHFIFLSFYEFNNSDKNPNVILFILWFALYYTFGVTFYRFYFSKKPYLAYKETSSSLIPSTKIIFITTILIFVLLLLPFLVLPFFTTNPDLLDQYVSVLDAGIDKSKTFDLVTNIILVFISPIILYRPFMAWIASLLGRSPLLKTAFSKTRGNYWNLVFLSFVMNLPYMMFSQLEFYFEINGYIAMFLGSPFMVYFSIVLGECYKVFYLDNED